MTISVIGADRRQFYLAQALCSAGYQVETYGVTGLPDSREPLATLLAKTDALVLPVPAIGADGTVAISGNRSIPAAALWALLPPEKLLFGGKLPKALQERFFCFDPMEDQAVTMANAVPTAEGAIQIAMEHTERTIWRSRALVIGFGRIGKILAQRLTGLGASVTVAARNPGDLAAAAAFGYRTTKTGEYAQGLAQYHCIFNTVPAMILPEAQLQRTAADCLLIDLASSPGGLDFAACEKLPRKAIHALSLPGKVAPATAGEILAQYIIPHLSGKE